MCNKPNPKWQTVIQKNNHLRRITQEKKREHLMKIIITRQTSCVIYFFLLSGNSFLHHTFCDSASLIRKLQLRLFTRCSSSRMLTALGIMLCISLQFKNCQSHFTSFFSYHFILTKSPMWYHQSLLQF